MNYKEINNRIKQINIENKIWIIYIGIIILSWYSNYLEEVYFKTDNKYYKQEYQKTIILIFTVLTIIYFYFLKSSIEDINNLKNSDSIKKKQLTYLSFIASLLIFISGLIFLYISIIDEDINVEIAFN